MLDENIEDVRVIDKHEVVRLTSISESTIRRLENRGEFPKRIQVSARRVGWRLCDIKIWIDRRNELHCPNIDRIGFFVSSMEPACGSSKFLLKSDPKSNSSRAIRMVKSVQIDPMRNWFANFRSII